MEKPLAPDDAVVTIDVLFQRLDDDDAAVGRTIEQLAARAAEIRPEQVIRRALDHAPEIGIKLINLLSGTRLPPDFSGLDFDPAGIGNRILQISLLRYLARADTAGSAELLTRFLLVPDGVVRMEALKSLGRLKTGFDPAILTRYLDRLPPSERGTAREIAAAAAQAAETSRDERGEGDVATGVLGSIEETRVDHGLIDFVLDDELLGTHIETRAQLSLPPSLETIKPGRLWLNRYQIKREIGRGAMGKAMLADDQVIDEMVALKFMRPEMVLDDGSVERFRREVKYARRIGHRNVIRVHDLLLHEGLCAISMEYFESRSLDRILRRMGAVAVRNGLKILYQVANGMAAAHEQSVVHRDLKPSNILIGKSGLLKIVDFGIASADRSAEATLTNAGAIVGSPAYLAPERVSQEICDERSDIYSLGIVGYYLFAGSLPYEGELHDILAAHQDGAARPLNEVRPEVPAEVGELIAAMMAVAPAARPPSMYHVRKRIGAML